MLASRSLHPLQLLTPPYDDSEPGESQLHGGSRGAPVIAVVAAVAVVAMAYREYAGTMTPIQTVVARFDVVAWDPASLPQIDGDWVSAITMRKTYTAGIVGSSIAHFISSGDEANRAYLAAEQISGTLDDGRTGTITIHHGGVQSIAANTSFGYLIPGTGSGDFADWHGTALITHDAHGAILTLAVES